MLTDPMIGLFFNLYTGDIVSNKLLQGKIKLLKRISGKINFKELTLKMHLQKLNLLSNFWGALPF